MGEQFRPLSVEGTLTLVRFQKTVMSSMCAHWLAIVFFP